MYLIMSKCYYTCMQDILAKAQAQQRKRDAETTMCIYAYMIYICI